MSSHALRRLPANPDPASDPALIARLAQLFAQSAADHDRSGAFPRENFIELQAHGLIGLVAPRAQGGGGASLAVARRVLGAVAWGEPATALILAMGWLQQHSIGRSDSRWPAHLRDRVLRDAVREGALINALRVEPALGSPARGGLPATVARREGGEWRLDGHKLYTTGIEGLTWLAVWARTDEEAPRTGFFLVPRSAAGIRVVASWDHLGLRASGSHEVLLEQVAIPLDHAVDLRAPAEWAPDAGSQTDIDAHATQQAWMVVLLGTLYDAVARAARDWLLSFLNRRAPSSLGTSLAALPRVQEHVGEMEALLRSNRVLLDDAAARVDAGQAPAASDSGLLKYSVTANAIRAVELALQLTGNHGLARQNPLERHYRDVLCSRIHTPQNDAILVAAGKAALGSAA
ncbi:acyl-CoA dehydrogenase [Variovorax sp. WS11]|uniref:acyl-CoA dehydrogenase family protein n=1 Tax=Variovorax sp. WS11 TaxID=1105204 RepID=UPI000D0CACFF|nr:acyl-CoA dehydrogenase family protein [Variovorax sp. WS11]NDZ16180.1 acyl-CoA/acyl-ACP dehydrogenase [Variovorax sp. WS11]PSL83970.1 acyl-CoA dehydrogenase [Variovorax sp. WS11]